MTYQVNFSETYTQMTDAELLKIAARRSGLVPEAVTAMDSEMARRGLSYPQTHKRKREVAGHLIKEARRWHRSAKNNKYFVDQIRGRWLLLMLSPLLLLPLLSFPKIVSEKWFLPIMFACYGVVAAISSVQPWVRQTRSFWWTIPVAFIVPLLVGHAINAHLATQSRNELRGAAFLSILAGYAIAIPLFLLLQRAERTKIPNR